MGKKVRMVDIAEKLGISVVSVSKGLSGKSGVSPEMRESILSAAREMGYALPAQTPEATFSGNIGILVSQRFAGDNAFYPNLYCQVLVRCNEAGYTGILEIVPLEAEKACTMPSMIQGKKVDGVIFMGELNRDYLRKVIATGLPYMMMDFYDETIPGDYVASDNLSGGFQVTNHLLQKGRRNICYVGSISATSSIMDRYLGYTKALLKAGLPVRPEYQIEDRDQDGVFIPLELPEPMPDAFVCNCDEIAYNLTELLKRRGIRVPEDVSVAGYDDYRFSRIGVPLLTTYRVNVDAMSQIVVERMVKKIEGTAIGEQSAIARGQLVVREST